MASIESPCGIDDDLYYITITNSGEFDCIKFKVSGIYVSKHDCIFYLDPLDSCQYPFCKSISIREFGCNAFVSEKEARIKLNKINERLNDQYVQRS